VNRSSGTPRHPGSGVGLEPLLDINAVAARLNITVRHVRRLIAERRIPFLKVGKLLRFDPVEIARWTASLAVVSARCDGSDEGLLQHQTNSRRVAGVAAPAGRLRPPRTG